MLARNVAVTALTHSSFCKAFRVAIGCCSIGWRFRNIQPSTRLGLKWSKCSVSVGIYEWRRWKTLLKPQKYYIQSGYACVINIRSIPPSSPKVFPYDANRKNFVMSAWFAQFSSKLRWPWIKTEVVRRMQVLKTLLCFTDGTNWTATELLKKWWLNKQVIWINFEGFFCHSVPVVEY